MSNHTNILFEKPTYSRTDYAALRSHCLGIPMSRIASLYYSDDAPQLEIGLERFLLDMREDLVQRAIGHNPALGDVLKNARVGGGMTTRALDILVRAADAPLPVPSPEQKIGQWVKPKTAKALAEEKIITIQHLIDYIALRGSTWHHSVPRIGRLKARVIENWLKSHEKRLGALNIIDVSPKEPSPILAIHIHPGHPSILAPLESITTSTQYDGSRGVNRSQAYCYITAVNDLQAIHCYLQRYADQKHAQRAYKKELERFLLWCIIIAQKPMSSVNASDCQEYAAFLANPSPNFCGKKAGRHTKLWKPFNDKGGLSPLSQRYAINILRSTFDYFCKVRYLAGNPFSVIKSTVVTKEVDLMHIEKALSAPLWLKLISALEGAAITNSQYRIALATILLLGDSGIRREEAATAKREKLQKSRYADVMELEVLGKGHKKRVVPVSARVMKALENHWNDRGLDISSRDEEHLLAPLITPNHLAAKAKKDSTRYDSYAPQSLYRLIQTSIKNLSLSMPDLFDAEDRRQLESTTPHAFRHTFGTLSVEKGMPIDVLQYFLGHQSVGTTSIYNKAKKKRAMEEAAKYFNSEQ